MCPGCGTDGLREAGVCLSCGGVRSILPGGRRQDFFIESYLDLDNWESRSTGFDLLKRGASTHRRIDRIGGPRIRDLKSYLKVDGVALNLGGGADNYEGYVNIDLGRYPSVHIVSSLEKIPYKDCSVDLVVSNSVLEHIYDYKAVLDEFYRVLRPGGYLYLCVPSLCTRHHELDYHRWTMPGLLSSLHRFNIVEHGSCRGVAYAVDPVIEALIVYRTRPGIIREFLRRIWLFLSRSLYSIDGDGSPEYVALSQTIYAIARK